jgi:hypothetical protein
MLIHLKRVLNQIGGPSSISIWSWLATIPIAILVSSTYEGTPTIREIFVWQSIVLMIHVVLGMFMFIAAKTFLTPEDRSPRPLTAISFFALLGTFRGLALELAQNTVGIAGAVFSERMAVNIAGSIIALSAIAIVVDDFRHDQQIVQRLQSARVAFRDLRAREESLLREADIDVLEAIRKEIENALRSDSSNADKVRAISQDIVRRISHDLYSQSSNLTMTKVATERVKFAFTEAFALMRAPHPLAVTLLVELTIFPAVVLRFGILLAIENAIVGGLLIYLGCRFVRNINFDSMWSPFRLLALSLILATAGGVAAFVCSALIPELNSIYPERVIGIATGVAGVGIAVSLRQAIQDGRVRRQESLSNALASESKILEFINQQIESRRRKAAGFLHSKVQSELIAKSLTGETTDEVIKVINKLFSEYSTPRRVDSQSRIEDLLSTWSAVLEIQLNFDEEARKALELDEGRGDLLDDFLCEALTNVIRHSSDKKALISIYMHEGRICSKVISEGSISGAPKRGIGLKRLTDRGISILLESSSHQTSLIASF